MATLQPNAQPVTSTGRRKKRKELTPEQIAERDRLRSAKFIELAEHRMGNALHRIGQLVSLANRQQYRYSSEQVVAMTTALQHAVNTVVDAFSAPERAPKTFSF